VARPIIRPASARKPIGLALQGGGSWGAYTWGVEHAVRALNRSATSQSWRGVVK
jgi:predicted acylesterase/phospholipase RssA